MDIEAKFSKYKYKSTSFYCQTARKKSLTHIIYIYIYTKTKTGLQKTCKANSPQQPTH